MRQTDRRAYNLEKKKIRENLLDILEASYVPRLREHLALRVTGTGATNARFCRAPAGNAYGAALTPAQRRRAPAAVPHVAREPVDGERDRRSPERRRHHRRRAEAPSRARAARVTVAG